MTNILDRKANELSFAILKQVIKTLIDEDQVYLYHSYKDGKWVMDTVTPDHVKHATKVLEENLSELILMTAQMTFMSIAEENFKRAVVPRGTIDKVKDRIYAEQGGENTGNAST